MTSMEHNAKPFVLKQYVSATYCLIKLSIILMEVGLEKIYVSNKTHSIVSGDDRT